MVSELACPFSIACLDNLRNQPAQAIWTSKEKAYDVATEKGHPSSIDHLMQTRLSSYFNRTILGTRHRRYWGRKAPFHYFFSSLFSVNLGRLRTQVQQTQTP